MNFPDDFEEQVERQMAKDAGAAMSEEIPDHVWEAARALRGAVTWGSNASVTIVAGFLWGAMLMERDRCAAIADSFARHKRTHPDDANVHEMTATEIAACIRDGEPT